MEAPFTGIAVYGVYENGRLREAPSVGRAVDWKCGQFLLALLFCHLLQPPPLRMKRRLLEAPSTVCTGRDFRGKRRLLEEPFTVSADERFRVGRLEELPYRWGLEAYASRDHTLSGPLWK